MTLPVSRATETAVVGGATIIGLLSGPDATDVFNPWHCRVSI